MVIKMTVQELIDKEVFKVIQVGGNLEQCISEPFCCDLLSIAMSKAPADSAWVTVMGNINTLAVAKLADVGGRTGPERAGKGKDTKDYGT